MVTGGRAWLPRGVGVCGCRGGACVVKGPCVAKGGMCGEGRVCVAKGGHVWQRGGMCGKRGGMCAEGGACVAKGGACVVCTPPTRYGRSLRGRYASYWNAFLFQMFQLTLC